MTPRKKFFDAKLKDLAHKKIDPLWESGKAHRGEVYKAISKALNTKPKNCHIHKLSDHGCHRVIDLADDGAIETMIVVQRAKRGRKWR